MVLMQGLDGADSAVFQPKYLDISEKWHKIIELIQQPGDYHANQSGTGSIKEVSPFSGRIAAKMAHNGRPFAFVQ